MSHLRLTAEQLAAIVKMNRLCRAGPRDVGKQNSPAGRPRTGRKPRKIVPSEHEEQAKIISWFAEYCLTHGMDDRLLFCIPNGAHLAGSAKLRGFKMFKLKSEGLRVGVPDLMLAIVRDDIGIHLQFAGLFIEMKRIGGDNPTQAQQEYHALLQAQGYRVLTCYGADEAIGAITEYLQN